MMSFRQRAFFLASRLPAARSRPIVPFLRYSTEASAPQPTPVTPSPTPEVAPLRPSSSTYKTITTAQPTPAESKPAAKTFAPKPARPAVKRATPLRSATRTIPARTVKPAPVKPTTPPPPIDTAPNPIRLPTTATNAVAPAIPDFDHAELSAPPNLASSAENRPGIQDIDWEKSYHGIGSMPVSQEQFDLLVRPLPPLDIEVKPDGVIYLPEIKYRRRLNETFGPMGWGMIPRGEAVVGESIVTREYALIIDGRFVAQAQGENNYFGADQLPSAVEGCKSNALMRCCKDLGIASELWDPRYIRWFKENFMQEAWVEHAVTKKKRTLWFRKGAVEVSYPWKLAK